MLRAKTQTSVDKTKTMARSFSASHETSPRWKNTIGATIAGKIAAGMKVKSSRIFGVIVTLWETAITDPRIAKVPAANKTTVNQK